MGRRLEGEGREGKPTRRVSGMSCYHGRGAIQVGPSTHDQALYRGAADKADGLKIQDLEATTIRFALARSWDMPTEGQELVKACRS